MEHFRLNMTNILAQSEATSIRQAHLVFIPIIHAKHFYLMCFNLSSYQVLVIDNMATETEFDAKYQGVPNIMVKLSTTFKLIE